MEREVEVWNHYSGELEKQPFLGVELRAQLREIKAVQKYQSAWLCDFSSSVIVKQKW